MLSIVMSSSCHLWLTSNDHNISQWSIAGMWRTGIGTVDGPGPEVEIADGCGAGPRSEGRGHGLMDGA